MAGIETVLGGAIAHAQAGRMGEAVRTLEEGLRAEPGHAGANGLMGTLLFAMGRTGEAVGFLERAHAAAPTDARLAYQLGAVLIGMGGGVGGAGNAARGVGLMSRAVELEPRWVQAMNGLAAALNGVGDAGRAVEMYRKSLGVDGGQAEALWGLGGVLVGSGRVREAAAAFREAGKKHPGNADVMGKLLSVLNYTDDASVEEVFEAHRRWGEIVMGRGSTGLPRSAASGDTGSELPVAREKRLRVGFLSPDLYDHSCAYFLRPILAHRDREKLEVVCYSWSERADWMTAQLKGLSDVWREVGGMAEGKLIETIRGDGLDVLIELSGHTAMGPLAALRNRVAPVQATYLGYPNTTGLPTIDWRIVDGVTDPAGAEAWHTEKLVRLEACFLCYSAPEFAPEVSARSGAGAPIRQSHDRGHVTFGSFNSIRKITPSVAASWAGVLKAVPGSNLLIKTRGLAAPFARGNIAAMFGAEGIEPERVEMQDMVMNKGEHLGMYGRVDVGLDTFPYNGTTTTCEALWMGVPVVTLEGKAHAGRVGASLLKAAGLGELVARDMDEFVEIAAGLARDPAKLGAMRAGMRERLKASILMDGAGHAARFYDAVRMMWREFQGAAR